MLAQNWKINNALKCLGAVACRSLQTAIEKNIDPVTAFVGLYPAITTVYRKPYEYPIVLHLVKLRYSFLKSYLLRLH